MIGIWMSMAFVCWRLGNLWKCWHGKRRERNMAYRPMLQSLGWLLLHGIGIDMHRQQVVRICQCQWLKKTSRSTLALSVVSTLCFLDFTMRDLNCWRPKRKNHPLVWINGWSITRMWRRLQRRSSPRRCHWGLSKTRTTPFLSKVYVRYVRGVGKLWNIICESNMSNTRVKPWSFWQCWSCGKLCEGRVRDHYWTLDLFCRALTLQVGKVWNIPAFPATSSSDL